MCVLDRLYAINGGRRPDLISVAERPKSLTQPPVTFPSRQSGFDVTRTTIASSPGVIAVTGFCFHLLHLRP